MKDFIRFMRHLFQMVHFIRGILAVFILLLLLCVIVVARAEEMPVGQAVYFVLVTALTIGYGDIAPATAWGRVASVATGIVGLLITGIVIAVAVHALQQASQEKINEQSGRRCKPCAKFRSLRRRKAIITLAMINPMSRRLDT